MQRWRKALRNPLFELLAHGSIRRRVVCNQLSAVHDAKDFAIALVGFAFIAGVQWPSWVVVIWCVSVSLLRAA